MVSLLQAVLLGVVQGLTEWLPVSSSGHLVIAQQLLGLDVPLLFDVMLHVGTALVVIWFMRREVIEIIKAFSRLNFRSGPGRWGIFIVLGSIPTALIGWFFHDYFAAMFSSLRTVGLALIATAIFLAIVERWERKGSMSAGKSLWIGLAQGLAIIPGISRSGATIGTALLLGVKKERAAKFSFLLAVPAILGAGLYEARNLVDITVGSEMIIGTLVAMVVGYFSLKALLRLVVAQKLKWFAVYCFVVGLTLLWRVGI